MEPASAVGVKPERSTERSSAAAVGVKMERSMQPTSAAAVGVMYVVYVRADIPLARTRRYLGEAAESSLLVRKLNAKLPTALSTNAPLSNSTRRAWTLVTNLSLGAHGILREGTTPWVVRLHALEASPFELTLSLDSHVTVCSSALHAALLREHALRRFDFAFNLEASRLTRGPAQPASAEDVLPHLFSMLLYKGAGLRQLLKHVFAALEIRGHNGERLHTDDQQAVQQAVRVLRERDYCDDTEFTPGDHFWYQVPHGADRAMARLRRGFCQDGDGLVATMACAAQRSWRAAESWRGGAAHPTSPPKSDARTCTPVRVWRLREAIGAFKRADQVWSTKSGGWSWIWPLYTRPWRGPLLALHSYDNRSGALGRRGICDILNAEAPRERLAMQLTPSGPILTPTSRSECHNATRTARRCATGSAHRFLLNSQHFSWPLAKRICDMLPVHPRARAAHGGELVPGGLVEPREAFWQWMRAHQQQETVAGGQQDAETR